MNFMSYYVATSKDVDNDDDDVSCPRFLGLMGFPFSILCPGFLITDANLMKGTTISLVIRLYTSSLIYSPIR